MSSNGWEGKKRHKVAQGDVIDVFLLYRPNERKALEITAEARARIQSSFLGMSIPAQRTVLLLNALLVSFSSVILFTSGINLVIKYKEMPVLVLIKQSPNI